MSYIIFDYYNFNRIIASAYFLMGELNNFWKDTSVKLHSKYLIFLSILINFLLWGCESYALRVSLLEKLEVFLHCSIRKILVLAITQVTKEIITNGTVRQRFFNMPTIQNQLAKLQLTFIVKVTRNSYEQLPTKILREWCKHKHWVGGALCSKNNTFVHDIAIIVPTVDIFSSLKFWARLSLDEK